MVKSKKEKSFNKKVSPEKKVQKEHDNVVESSSDCLEKDEMVHEEQRIADLEVALKIAQQEKAEVEEFVKRQKAEFDNFRRRSEEERKSFKLLANEQLLLDFLPILDDFDKAIDVKVDDVKINSFLDGFRFIYKHLLDVLHKNHVVSNTKVGDVFDHNMHRALDFEQGDGQQDTVVEVYQKGFSFHDKVIRLSAVKVKKKKVAADEQSDKS